MNRDFWHGRRVFVTGHTGFKGSWLTQWLKRLGAQVTGYSLAPPTSPSLFEQAAVASGMTSLRGDIRDLDSLRHAILESSPEVVIHMAAQSLVRASYKQPVETYSVNVMGTVHLLEAVRSSESVRSIVIVTSDKCYENREWVWPYRENEPMGGKDPYSSSKGCAELVTSAYRESFFAEPASPRVASVRAGNVIGGGDWAEDRLIPDLLRAFGERRPAIVRNPGATRPWQFVLDPLRGYLQLAEALFDDDTLAHGWNFGPSHEDVRPVSWVADRLVDSWGEGASWKTDAGINPPEAFTLKLDSSRARESLLWKSMVDLDTAIRWIVEWHRAWYDDPGTACKTTLMQIERFEALVG